jgi:hypothetical protein
MNKEKIKLLIDSIQNTLDILKLELNCEDRVEVESNKDSNVIKLSLEDLLRNDRFEENKVDYHEEI